MPIKDAMPLGVQSAANFHTLPTSVSNGIGQVVHRIQGRLVQK